LEEIATRAIRHPELRKVVPQAETETVSAKSTTMQIPDQYMQPAKGPIKGTVTGPASAKANAVEEVPAEPKKSGKTIYLIIAAVIIAGLAVGWFLLSGKDHSLDVLQEESAINADSLLKLAEAQEFEECMNLFRQDDPDSINSARNRMAALAEKGNKDAIHEMAYNYAPIPNDQESDRRKRRLGWSINADGIPTSPEINQQSINWLEKAIAVSDSTDYQALYWLTYFYASGTIVKTDYAKAMQLLVKASEEAGRQQDVTFKQKIDDMITQLRQMQ
jgi:hypothetical protein